jgi:hypothetical protein
MKVKNKNKNKKSGSGRWVRLWRRGFVAAVVVVMVGTSDAWAASGDGGMAQVKSFADHLANYVTAIAATVAVLFIAINGVKYTTAGGNPSRQLEARNGLIAAGAGLAIALSARVIVGLVVSALH